MQYREALDVVEWRKSEVEWIVSEKSRYKPSISQLESILGKIDSVYLQSYFWSKTFWIHEP